MLLTLGLGIIGALGALLMVATIILVIINLFREEKKGWKKILIPGFIGFLVSGVAAVSLFVLVLSNGRKIANKGKDLASNSVQKVVTKATKTATVGIGEGFVETGDHFVDREVQELIQDAKSMSIEFIGYKTGSVAIGLKNNGSKAINIDDLLKGGIIVAVDSDGYDHPFSFNERKAMEVPLLLPKANRRLDLNLDVKAGVSINSVRLVK